MRRALVFVLLLGCELPPDVGARDASVDAEVPSVEDAWLRDEQGGVVILRGTNVSGDSKDPPDFLPNDFASSADFARLRDELGMNAVRFLIFWEAVEPERGAYDEAYLAEVRRRIEAAGEAGLFVIVDMHQDVYGRGFGFSGAPYWSCDEVLYASFQRPSEWYLGYAEPEVQTCFDRLYGDAEMRGAFAAAWRRVAAALRGASGLFAYEVLNEPHWGSASFGVFERVTLPAFYAECIDAIRTEDPDAMVLVEPAPIANVGVRTSLAPPDRPRLAFAPHVYPPALELGTGWTGSRGDLDAWMDGLRGDARRMGLPLVVTEVGARAGVPGAIDYLTEVFDAFDAAALGAVQWDAGRGSYGIFDAEGALSEIGQALARPHPARVAGVPRSFGWDRERGELTLRWVEDGSADGDTLVTAPSLAFPQGVEVVLDGEATIDGAMVRIPQRGGARELTLRAR